ncbi:MAG: Aminopeptidase N [Chloroflexi bacterium ADurb.Bin325]|nr:MAG: Aminopeptidase N [Chloroflexi bacterium ADurb.Bin325]
MKIDTPSAHVAERPLRRLALLALLFVLAACVPPAPSLIVTPTAAATATATPAPAGEPAQPPAEPDDPAVYTAALRPEAADEAALAGLTRYRLDVTVAPDLSRFGGSADIRYTNRAGAALDEIYVHLYPNLWAPVMQPGRVEVDGQPVTPRWQRGDFVLGIPLLAPLAPGAAADLHVLFDVVVPEEGVGNYDELAFKDGVLALTHFYPTVAVYDAARGGWQLDRPALQGDVIYHDVSLYDVRLTTADDVRAAATGVELARETSPDGAAVWRFGGGPMRDFTATLSREYEAAAETVDGVTYTSYFLPGDEINGKAAPGIAAAAVELFEAEFGPYPYRELDIAATGTTAGGIEYPGLIVIARDLYARPAGDAGFEMVIVHETAHQWWYGVVGNDQVNDPWLDEALAQYSTYLYFAARYGKQAGEAFLATLDRRWERVERVEKPIGLPVSAYSESEYSGIVYGRGPLFFVALRERLGAERMAELLRRYYAANTWGIAHPAEFEALAEEVAGAPLDDLFDAWVYPP